MFIYFIVAPPDNSIQSQSVSKPASYPSYTPQKRQIYNNECRSVKTALAYSLDCIFLLIYGVFEMHIFKYTNYSHGGLGNGDWHFHNLSLSSQPLTVGEHGGVNCPRSCPTNRGGVPCHSAPHFTAIQAAGVSFACQSGKDEILAVTFSFQHRHTAPSQSGIQSFYLCYCAIFAAGGF